MPFTFPNDAVASFPDQAEVHQADVDILIAGFSGTGVISGCAVTAQGSPDMTVAVAAGAVMIAGVVYPVTAGSSSSMTADASNPRFYLIEITTAGAIALNAGTAASNPLKPAPTASRVVLAEVYIPAADTAIGSTQIIDKRVVVRSEGIVALSDGANIATDASLGSTFKVTLGGNRTLDNPTNPVAGQKIVYRFKQDGTGSRTITLGSAFRLGTDLTAVTLTTTAGKTDYMGCIYNADDSKWDVIALSKGY